MTIRSELLMCFAPHSRRCSFGKGSKPPNHRKTSTSESESSSMKQRFNIVDVINWGKSFKALIESKEGRDLFRVFLRTEYSQENILFYEACEQLDMLQDEQEIFEKARNIYEDFVSTLADREISLDSTIRDEIQLKMINPDKDMFNSARQHIYNLMLRDSYPRFKSSEIYRMAREEGQEYS